MPIIRQGGSSAAVGGVLFILLLFACVVLHEFGHALAGKAFGINTPDITLLPIGGVARLERIPDEPVQELVIAAAGPAVTALIALGAFIGGGSWDYPPTTKTSIPDLLFTMNVVLLLFNLAAGVSNGRRPGFARTARDAFELCARHADRRDCWPGICVRVRLFRSAFLIPSLIFIALFVYIGASQEAALAQMKDVSRRFPVSSAMVREFRTLAADATLEEAVDALLATSQHDFPVMDETGNVAGLLTRHDLISALRKNDPTLRVGDVMRRDIPTVTTGTRFEDAFRIMQECDCPAVPVLDRMKRLVGLLTPENVTELMMVQSAMPQRRVL